MFWTWKHTHVRDLFGPHGVNQITLLSIRGFLKKTPCPQRLLGLIILLAFFEQSVFLGCFHQQRRNSNGPIQPLALITQGESGRGGGKYILLRSRIQRNHRKRTSNQHIVRLLRLSLRRNLGHLQGNLHTRPARRIGDLAAELEIADFHQRVLDCDSVHGGRDGCDGVTGVFVGDHTGEGVEVHDEGAEAVLLVYKKIIVKQTTGELVVPDMPRRVQITIRQPFILG